MERTLAEQDYVAERALAVSVYLALELEQPLFLEGEAGVGKTEIAKVLAAALGRPLLRLQCYEGLDRNSALYEWNFPRQMMRIRLLEAAGRAAEEVGGRSVQPHLSHPAAPAGGHRSSRPRARAPHRRGEPLISKSSRLSCWSYTRIQVTIPEIGTIRAREKPPVVLTSNRTREVHALKRRCLYYWIDYPGFEKEYEIVQRKVPGLAPALAEQVCRFVQELRQQPLFKAPGVAETIVWARALQALGETSLRPELIEETIGCLVKYRDDVEWMRRQATAGGR